ncbi:MAG: FHA domain-containing protein, partial [bacterium]
MAEKTFELVFLNTARAAESIPLQPGESFIGRSRANAIVVEDPLASRKHLRIETTGDAVIAEDLDSSHGTFLNDKRVRGRISLN